MPLVPSFVHDCDDHKGEGEEHNFHKVVAPFAVARLVDDVLLLELTQCDVRILDPIVHTDEPGEKPVVVRQINIALMFLYVFPAFRARQHRERSLEVRCHCSFVVRTRKARVRQNSEVH